MKKLLMLSKKGKKEKLPIFIIWGISFAASVYAIIDFDRLKHLNSIGRMGAAPVEFCFVVYLIWIISTVISNRNTIFSVCKVNEKLLIHKNIFRKTIHEMKWKEVKEVAVYEKEIKGEYRMYITKNKVSEQEKENSIRRGELNPNIFVFPYTKENVDTIKQFYHGNIPNLSKTDYRKKDK